MPPSMNHKKSKHSHPLPAAQSAAASFIAQHHPEKPSARATVGEGKRWTTSIAIPGSIVLNAQTMELRGWLVGQIARTCAIFSISEIIIYRDAALSAPPVVNKPRGKYRDTTASSSTSNDKGEGEGEDDPAVFLARILEYLETPQYLRKSLFPLHPSLRLAGLLPPLDCPHHLRRDDLSPFREGVVVERIESDKKGKGKGKSRVMVDVGLWDAIEVEGAEAASVGSRVTIRMADELTPIASLVTPSTPTHESGLYWGYRVRMASSLATVFSESPFKHEGGYDVTIGTSERGDPVESILNDIPPFRHSLLVLGPLAGLEITIGADQNIPLQAEEASDSFDHWINVVEGQGSRTVRTEEALPIALARLKSTIERQGSAGTKIFFLLQ